MEFVVNIIYDGEILVPNKKMVVALPFDSEYSLRLRNKTGKRAVANIFIDGEAISDNNEGVIIDAHSYVDVDRFINVKKKFKFVNEHSSEAADGIVKVEWRLEANQPSYARRSTPIVPIPQPIWYTPDTPWNPCDTPYTQPMCPSWIINSLSGCTVEGAASQQDFTYENFISQLGPPTITTITLRGYSS